MDLLALFLDVRQRQCRVRAAEATAVVEEVLGDDAFGRVYAAAQPLFEWAHAHLPPTTRRPADATLVSIELDALDRTVRLGYVAEHGPISRPPESASSSPGLLSPESPLPLALTEPSPSLSRERERGLASSGSLVPSRPPSSMTPVPELAFCSGDYNALQLLLREPARAAVREVRPRKPDPEGLTPTTRWEYLYQHGGDGWELGRTPPPLADWIARNPPVAGQRSIVLGCGRGHEAQKLAHAGAAVGATVVAVDIADSAVRFLQAATIAEGLTAQLTVVKADLFTLSSDDPRHQGAYDLVFEHCCFCAIEPHRRDEYVAAAASLLKPSGQLVGLFYCHDYAGGPPYATTAAEVHQRLGAAFTVLSAVVPANSIITRAGQELLVTAVRR